MTRCSQRALFHLVALRNSAMLALLIASVVAQLSRSPTFSSWAFIMRSGLKLALAAAILVWTGRVEPALSEPADFYKGKDVKLIISATVGWRLRRLRARSRQASRRAHSRKSHHHPTELAG